MREIKPEIIIVKIDNNVDIVNEMRNMEKNHIKFNMIVIRNEGNDDIGFMIYGHENMPFADSLSKKYNQKHYFISHNDRMSYFVCPETGKQKYFGFLKEIEPDNILGLSTYFIFNNKYYATEM